MSSSANAAPSFNSNNSAGATVIATTGTIVGGAVLIVITVLIIGCVQKSKSSPRNPSQESSAGSHVTALPISGLSRDLKIEMGNTYKLLEKILQEKPMIFTPQHLMQFTDNYTKKLGSGSFGVVYKGQFPNGMQVAVKVLHGTLDKRAEEQFIAEVGTIGRTHHTNLIKLYGFCFDTILKALVYEYIENGSLEQYLFHEKNTMEWGKLHEIAIGTAKGIRYLHEECQHKIVHYDIKPGNILLDAEFLPKVSDFGLAKLCDRGNVSIMLTGCRGTPGYAAPELWLPLSVTHKCDVYSFGMLLFEILGKRRNLVLREGESQEWYPRWVWQKVEQRQLDSVFSLAGIETKYRKKAEIVCKVALMCVQFQPEMRPSMSSVVRMLEEEEEALMPSNPFRYLTSCESSSPPWSASTAKSSNSKSNPNNITRVDIAL